MTPVNIALSVLRALRDEGQDYSATSDGETVYLPSLAVTLSVDSADGPSQEGVVNAEVISTHERLAAPVRFTAVGFGDDAAAASHSAAEQWFDVVFPVLHNVFTTHKTENVTLGKISAVNERGERFNWRVHVGPIRILFSGMPEPARPNGGVFLHALRHEIAGVSAQRLAFWIDAFVARQADGSVQSDCRLLNEYWPEATDRLQAIASTLLPETSGFASYRQFMFFEPVASDATRAVLFDIWRWSRRLFGVRRPR